MERTETGSVSLTKDQQSLLTEEELSKLGTEAQLTLANERLRLQAERAKELAQMHWSRVDNLGTDFRRLFMAVASGLFLGGLLKGFGGAAGSTATDPNFGILFIGIAAILVLANVLYSKRRSANRRDDALKALGEDNPSPNYFTSVSFIDLLGLIILSMGIAILADVIPLSSSALVTTPSL